MAKKQKKNSPVAESKENKVEEVVNETTTETSETTETETKNEEVVSEKATETETKTEEVVNKATKVEEKPAKEKKPKAEKAALGTDEKEVLKTSEQWLEEFNYRIMTHDGWNRKTDATFQFSFYEEKISKKEFDKRLLKSAVKPK